MSMIGEKIPYTETVSDELFDRILATFTRPRRKDAETMNGGRLGIVFLEPEVFPYDRGLGYDFHMALVVSESGRQVLCVRVDSWDPDYRARAAPGEIDFCIPLAHDGATEREKLSWKIPFGGSWSDCKEEVTVLFTQDWAEWFAPLEGLVFANPGAESGAFMKFDERWLRLVELFSSE